MRISAILTVIACLFGLTGLSHAGQTLASPAIFNSSTQFAAYCIIRNIGTTPISVVVNIFDEAGNVFPSTSIGDTDCDVPVPPGRTCVVTTFSISNGVAYACSATASGSVKKLRGILFLFDTDPSTTRSAELR